MKIFHKIFNIFALVFISVGFASAQFGADVRVSDTTGGVFGCVLPWIVRARMMSYLQFGVAIIQVLLTIISIFPNRLIWEIVGYRV